MLLDFSSNKTSLNSARNFHNGTNALKKFEQMFVQKVMEESDDIICSTLCF